MASSGTAPLHLAVVVHGLFGSDVDLFKPAQVMRQVLADETGGKGEEEDGDVMVFVPKSNNGGLTLQGIEACGSRLVEEISNLVKNHKSLRTISLIGHSLGGLLTRYAAGQAYDPEKKTIFGLEPLHYISVVTPHLGNNDNYMTDIRNEDSVTPCLRWMGQIPCLGKVLAFLFHVFESFFVSLCLRRTGRDLFLRDGEPPIVVKMASSDEKVPYLDALASFKERTCYGNIRGDHLVAWENATIRRKCDLPKISSKEVPYGVVNEEVSPACPPEGPSEELVPIHHSPSRATCPKVEVMISNLEALGWRRVDVKTKILIHKGAPWAHDNIISKKDIHDNFKTVALHSSSLLINTVKRYETDNVV